MRFIVTTLCAAATSLALASGAQADRIGQATVRNRPAGRDLHVNFRLRGNNWAQAIGQTEATPEIGVYGQTGSTGCQMMVNVSGVLMASRPKVTSTHVDVAGIFPPVRIVDLGVNKHGIRWWAGSQVDVRAAAVGYQKAPASLAVPGRPWLVYQIVVRGTAPHSSCTPAQGLVLARGITLSMHLSAGKITPMPPYMG